METAATATVSTGPPPGDPPEPMQHNGGIAATELHGAPPTAPEPQGSGAADGDSTPRAPSTMEVDAQAAPAPSLQAPPLTPSIAPAIPPHTPTSLDVFADTDASATPPISRHFGEDGDAVMDGEVTTSSTRVFASQLVADLGNATSNETTSFAQTRPPRTRMPRNKSTPAAKPTKPQAKRADATRASRPTAPTHRTHNRTTPVWSRQGAAALRASLGGGTGSRANVPSRGVSMPAHHPPDDEQSQDTDPTLAPFYVCAKKPAHMRHDGDQRAMTKLETETLFRWMDHQVHLAQPPSFLKETHTSTEQDAFADFHWDHLGFRLYGILPAGCSLSDENAKYHFCLTALQASSREPVAQSALERMLAAARVITCESKSRIVILRFVRPEVRDSWRDLTFPFGSGSVTLEATDSLTTDLPKIGLDGNAMKLLYHVFVRGHRGYRHGEMRTIIATAARVPVFAVEWVESVGLTDFTGPRWKCTFNQITCPKALEHVRRLDELYGTTSEVLSVHHPRASRRIPCAKCLSVRHVTNECKNEKHAAEGLDRHTLTVEVTPPSLPSKLTAALSPKKLERQLHQLREHAAPDVGSRLREEEGERLAKIELKAKRRAERAAREAAAEARAQKADKAHAAAVLARSQLKESKAGLRAVTKQLKALQRCAQEAHEGVAAPEQSHSTPVVDTATALTQTAQQDNTPAQESTTPEHEQELPSADESEHGWANESTHVPETKETTESGHETGTESGNDASIESDNESVTDTGNDTKIDLGHGLTAEPSQQANDETATCEMIAVIADAPVLSHGERDSTGSDIALPSSEPQCAELVVHVDKEDIDDDAPWITVRATGKRSSPPTPTSSDDERAMYSNAHRIKHPFDADESSIDAEDDGLDYLGELLADIEASGKASRPVLALTGATPSVNVDAPDPNTAVATTETTTAVRVLKQLPMSNFYGPQSREAAQAQLEQDMVERMTRPVSHWLNSFPSQALDDLLDSLRSPLAIATWLHALHAHMIVTPGTGGCLYYALHVSRTRSKLQCKAITARTENRFTNHTFEGNWYKARICESFLEYLEPMLSDGTITIADLKRRLPTGAVGTVTDNRDAALAAITKFIKGIAATNVGKKLERAQWGADEELFAALWFMREPLFIITEDKDKRTSVRVIWLERPHADGTERIIQLFPEAGEAHEMLRVFLRHRFLPTVLIHVTVSGDGHFNSLRFEEKLYVEWTSDDKTGEKMRGRLQHALLHLGWYVAPPTTAGITKSLIVALAESGSVYEPSQPELLDSTATPLSLEAPLSPPAHYALLCSLNPRGRRRGVLADLWTQAENQNLQAYRRWDAEQPQGGERSEPDTLNGGCRHWSSQLSQLVMLLRSLPYPEVAMSLLPEDLIQRMGNELNNLASDGGVPDFVRAEDPVTARRHWIRLVVLVVVASDDDLIELRSVDWLRQHPVEALAALHNVRLYDWTCISKLARPTPHAQPKLSLDLRSASVDRS